MPICVSLYPSPHSDGRTIEPVAAGAGPMVREAARWRLLWRAALEADIIHLYFGESLLMPRRYPDLRTGKALGAAEIGRRLYARAIWGKDLPLLKALGKRLVFSFLGDDVRQRAYSEAAYEISIARYADPDYYPPRSDEWKRRVIRLAGQLCGGDFRLQSGPAERAARGVAAASVFASVRRRYHTCMPEPFGGSIRIAHAPTHFGAKGTSFVLAAIAELRAWASHSSSI